jgi:hypothetical protein
MLLAHNLGINTMADVMNSLFGVTPEALMAQREAALAQQATNFAQLSPMQSAQAGFYTAGNRLAGAAGGLLGAQDPEMAKAAALQGILKQADTTSPEGLATLARTLAGQGFGQQALQVSQQAQGMMKTQSEISKNMRERAAADPVQQLIRTGKYTPASVAAYAESRQISDLDTIDKADPTALSETKEGIFLINKLTGQKIQRIGDAPERASKLSVSPEIKMAPDIVGAVNAADKATEKEVAMLDSARLAKQLINQTSKSNNSQTWEAARTTIAKAVGESKLSNEDIRRTGVDPRLVEGALDWVNKKIEGVPNADIQKQLYVLGSVLENSASSRYDVKVGRFRSAAEAAKFPGNPSTYFPTAAERSNTPASNAVDWSSLKK